MDAQAATFDNNLIKRAVEIYVSSGHIVEFCPPLNNTSDPRNGNWGENMVPVEVYIKHPILRSLTKHIAVEPSAIWNPFIIDADEDDMIEWV